MVGTGVSSYYEIQLGELNVFIFACNLRMTFQFENFDRYTFYIIHASKAVYYGVAFAFEVESMTLNSLVRNEYFCASVFKCLSVEKIHS